MDKFEVETRIVEDVKRMLLENYSLGQTPQDSAEEIIMILGAQNIPEDEAKAIIGFSSMMILLEKKLEQLDGTL